MTINEQLHEENRKVRSKFSMGFGYMQAMMDMAAKGWIDENRLKKEVDKLDIIWAAIHNNDIEPHQFQTEILGGN